MRKGLDRSERKDLDFRVGVEFLVTFPSPCS